MYLGLLHPRRRRENLQLLGDINVQSGWEVIQHVVDNVVMGGVYLSSLSVVFLQVKSNVKSDGGAEKIGLRVVRAVNAASLPQLTNMSPI